MVTRPNAEPWNDVTTRRDDHMPQLRDILRSPSSGRPLVCRDGGLETESGDERYEIVGDVPILLSVGSSLFDPVDVLRARPRTRRKHLRSWLRRRLTANAVSGRNLSHLGEILATSNHSSSAKRRILVVGGGILGFGVERLEACEWVELVETDVYIGPRTRIVCDAHDLPFADGAFDAVVIQAVLEHVIDPPRVVSELHRVLGPDGIIYSEVPFMQQVHEGAYDFTRWTLGGHRRLLRGFDELDAGAVGGPGEALSWSIRYFLLALAGSNRWTRRLVVLVAISLTLPLRWADHVLAQRPSGVDAAAGTYFLGKRRESPRSDSDILTAYHGTIGTPVR